MKKIKTINKLLSSLTLLSPLSGVGFNSQYQNTQKVITENSYSMNNYVTLNAEPVKMGDIWVTVDNSDNTIITGYSSGDGKLIINSNISSIAQEAFRDNNHISSIDFSNATNLKKVDYMAFVCCGKVTEAILPLENVTSIAKSAFAGMGGMPDLCENVYLTLGKNVNYIGNGAFNYCKFKSLNISPENNFFSFATNLGPNAKVLLSKPNLEWIDNSEPIGDVADGEIIIPSNITNIKSNAFDYTNIASLDLSNATSLTTIGDNAFMHCWNLTGNITIPSSVTSIGNLAISFTNLDDLFFLSKVAPSFGNNWQPTLTGKVYVPQGTKDTFLAAPNFGIDSSQVIEWSFDSASANILGSFDQIDISVTDVGSSSEFSVTGCSPETLSQDAFIWSLVPTGETKLIPDGLWISKGKINWNNVPEGIYTFKIKSSFDVWSKESDQTITINATGDTPVPPEPTPEKSNIPLILGLAIGLGIPVILAIAFIIWYFTKKKKTTVKI